jgi:SAM-dependent methyltransferase
MGLLPAGALLGSRAVLINDDATELLTKEYDGRADLYQEIWAPVLETAGRRLLCKLAGGRVRNILDVGTGVGTMLPHLQEAFPGAFVVGVDRSPGMLSLVPQAFRGEVMDARQLSVPAESVDLVTMIFMLFHLVNPLEGLREARRVLRRAGRLATITWGEGGFESDAMRLWTECLDAHGAARPDPETPSSAEKLDTPRKMEAILRAAGFASAHAWTEDLVATIEREDLIRLKTRMAPEVLRFNTLDTEIQRACIADARRLMEGLAPGAFVARGPVVYAVARV